MPKKNPKNLRQAMEFDLEKNLCEVKEILLQVDHEFFSACQFQADPCWFSKYRVIVSMPLMYPNMDFVHPVHKKDLHFKIRCRVNEHSFAITDDGYIGEKFQSLGYYGFTTAAFTVSYHKKELGRRLKVWYALFRAVLPLIGVK